MQADCVAKLASKSPHNGVQIKRTDAGESLQIVPYSPNSDFATHLIEGNTATSGREDYRIVGVIYVGALSVSEIVYTGLTTSGSFVAVSEQFGYTSPVTAISTAAVHVPFRGAEIRVHPYMDNPGNVAVHARRAHHRAFNFREFFLSELERAVGDFAVCASRFPSIDRYLLEKTP